MMMIVMIVMVMGMRMAMIVRRYCCVQGYDIWKGGMTLIDGSIKEKLESHDNIFYLLSPAPPGPRESATIPDFLPPPTPPLAAGYWLLAAGCRLLVAGVLLAACCC